MSRLTCDCAVATLPSIGATRCGVNFGMVEIAAFIQLSVTPKTAGTSGADLTLASNIVDKTKWTGATGYQLSPMIKGWTPGGGDAVNVEEDTDADGMGRVIRVNPYTAEVVFRGIRPEQASAMEQLRCLAEMRDLGVYLFTPDGRILGLPSGTITGDNPTGNLNPIPVGYAFMSPRQFGNRDEFDSNTLTMKIDSGYLNDITAMTLAYGTSGALTYWSGIDLLAVGNAS